VHVPGSGSGLHDHEVAQAIVAFIPTSRRSATRNAAKIAAIAGEQRYVVGKSDGGDLQVLCADVQPPGEKLLELILGGLVVCQDGKARDGLHGPHQQRVTA